MAYNISADQVNELALHNEAEFVSNAEIAYHKQVQDCAKQIKAQMDTTKFVMLSGPSASGKTTTAKKLAGELHRLGANAIAVSLDNFYIGFAGMPRLPDGAPDFENVTALDFNEIRTCFSRLIETGASNFPIYDFYKRERSEEKIPMTMGANDVVIVEGIHALNPLVTACVSDHFTRIYVSVGSEFRLKGDLVLSARQLRLMRRMIRDYHFRNSPIENTLDMWAAVLEGEVKYIKPYKKDAHLIINSVHSYEPCIYHHDLLGLFEEISKDSAHYDTVMALKRALDFFADLELTCVPEDSMLREFIG